MNDRLIRVPGRSTHMSVAAEPDRLRHKLAARGLEAIDLARTAGLGRATMSAVLASRLEISKPTGGPSGAASTPRASQ